MFAEQIQLTATTTNAKDPVTWSSSNTAVATVNATGLVMASLLNLGQVTITATSGEASGTATLTITRGIVFLNVSSGSNHTCGVGGVPGSIAYNVAYCWGDNSSGQLGNGTTINSATPVPVSGGLSFSTVSAGGNQTCGLTTDGVTYCWGDNSSGQLGNGTTTSSSVPSRVAGGHGFTRVSVGDKHVCAESGDGGTVPHCWGDNSSGQLGNGTMTNSPVPVPVTINIAGGRYPPGYSSIAGVSAGSSHTCATASGNEGFITYSTSICWGDNGSGQLGNGTTINSAVPVALSVTPGVAFSAGTFFTCTYSSGPNAAMFQYCWGNNGVGQLGNGTTTNSTTPVLIAGGISFTSISSGGMHACGVGGVAGAYCWGGNSSGQLGNGTMTNSAMPVAVAGNLEFLTVSAGGSHTCGISGIEGGTYCWGDNTFGQLGNSWTTASSVPVNVAGSP